MIIEVVIIQNGTSPSECRHSLCWYTKGQFGLKWPKHYNSINRGLGVGDNESILERKVMLVVYIQSLGATKLRFLWLQRSPCLKSWVVLLSYSSILNKENFYSNLVLSLFHVYWLMNILVYMLNMIFI